MRSMKIQSFLCDCDMLQNGKKVLPVITKFGTEAERVLIHVLSALYSSHTGFYLEINDKTLSDIRVRCGAHLVTDKYIEDVIEALVDKNYFDKDMYYKESIIISKETQRRWHMAVKRRNIDTTGLKYFTIAEDTSIKNEDVIKTLQVQFKKDFGVIFKDDLIRDIDSKLFKLKNQVQEYGSMTNILLVAIRRMMDYTYRNPTRYFYKGLFGEDQYLLRLTPKEEEKGSYIKLVRDKMDKPKPTVKAPKTKGM